MGVLDTGFSGFIQIAKDDAYALGLSLNKGYSQNELADGTRRILPLADAVVLVGGCAPIAGRVQVSQPPCAVLIGRDSLRKAQKALLLSAGGVYLIDEDYVKTKLPLQ